MRIAIVGAGGVGGLLAGLLSRAGSEVVVLARGAHADAIRAGGLRVDSPLGRFTAPVAAVASDAAALGPVDAVLVAVKAWQVAELAPSLRPLVAAGGVAVPLQNGVEAAGTLAAALGEERVAGGLVAVLSWIDGPGAVKHVGGPPRVKIGERGARAGRPSARLDGLAAVLRAAGAEVEVGGRSPRRRGRPSARSARCRRRGRPSSARWRSSRGSPGRAAWRSPTTPCRARSRSSTRCRSRRPPRCNAISARGGHRSSRTRRAPSSGSRARLEWTFPSTRSFTPRSSRRRRPRAERSPDSSGRRQGVTGRSTRGSWLRRGAVHSVRTAAIVRRVRIPQE